MNSAYGAPKIIPIGWRPNAMRASRCALDGRVPGRSSPSSGGNFGRGDVTLVMARRLLRWAGCDELVDLRGGRSQRLIGTLLAEDDRLRPVIAEGLPDLDRVRHVGHLDHVGCLCRELLVRRVCLEIGRVQ